MARQANEGDLLKQIRTIRKLSDPETQATVLNTTFGECLRRCQAPTCLRQDFDDLGQWIVTAKAFSTGTHNATLAAILNRETQSQLTQLFWERLDDERSSISKRAESILPSMLQLLDRVAEAQAPIASTPDTTSSSSMRRQPLSVLASLLLDRASQDMETRTALVVFDNLLSLYDADEILKRTSDLYSQLINKFSAQVDVPTRRSRVCMKIVRRRGEAMGLHFEGNDGSEDANKNRPSTSSLLWSQWTEDTTRPIIEALQSHDSYRRTSTSIYHVVELFQLAPATILAVVAGLLEDGSPSRNLPAILATLRAGKGFGLCRVGEATDSDQEIMLGDEVISASQSNRLWPAYRPCIVVPAALLAACGQSSDEELQVSAFSLVVESKSAVAQLTQGEYALLYAFLQASFSSTHASGRGSLNSLFGKLLARITAVGYAVEREIAKIKDDDPLEKLDEKRRHQAGLQASRNFLTSATSMILGNLHPGAPYHVVIASLTFLELILAAGVDPQYQQGGAGDTDPGLKATFGTFRKGYSLGVALIDPRMVKTLLSCADSTYPDIQSRALGLLHRFPAPLQGLTDQSIAEQEILLKAKQLLLSGRDSESAAAGGLLRVYQQVYIRRLGWTTTPLVNLGEGSQSSSASPKASRELLLFSDLLTFLEAQIDVAEKEGLFVAAKNNPLHGCLVTLQRMLDDPIFWSTVASDAAFQQELRGEFVRAQSLIDRIWCLTRPILCAAAPEGSNHSTASILGDGDEVTADTEVARALAAAEGETLDYAKTESIIRKSQVMLSYSWRGMKEAAALLGKLVSSPLRYDAKLAQVVWRPEEIQEVGDRFSLWMTAVRHRGAFSTIYPAYSSAAAAIVRGDWLEVKNLPKDWLQSFLSMITNSESSISTTRRSAGIGYAVLALITALPLRQDKAPLGSAMRQLIDAANDCFGSEDPKIVAAHIHTINILRVLVLDASLAEAMTPFVDTLLSLAIRRFQSPVWYIRNAGLMLFAALSPRAFPARKTNEDIPSSQLPANRFFQMYPTLYPALRAHLTSALSANLHKATNRADAEQAGSLYAVLFLLSRMQAVDHEELGGADTETLQQLVGECLGSVDFKIREIASRAYSSLTTRSDVHAATLRLVNTCHSTGSENLLHGALLTILRLGRTHCGERGDEKLALAVQSLPITSSTHSPAVIDAFQKTLSVYKPSKDIQAVVGKASIEERITRLRQVLWSTPPSVELRESTPTKEAQSDESFLQPIIDSLFSPGLNNPTQRIMNQCFYGLFATLLSLLIGTGGNPHVLFLNIVAVCLWASVNWFVAELAKVTPPPAEGSDGVTADFQLRSEAADELYEIYDETGYLGSLASEGVTLEQEWDRLAALTFGSERIPLRESSLTLLGCLTTSALRLSRDVGWKKKVATIYSRLVCTCAREEEHVESRLAAAQSLSRCGPWLFPGLPNAGSGAEEEPQGEWGAERAVFKARVAVLNLLQDDEEEVRHIAAELVSMTISRDSGDPGDGGDAGKLRCLLQAARQSVASSTISTSRAWTWMRRRYSAGDGEDLWTGYLCREVILPSDRDLRCSLESALNPADVLFAVERPNLYRDVEAEVLDALSLLRSDTGQKEWVQRYFDGRASSVGRMAEALLQKPQATRSVVGRLVAVRVYAAICLSTRDTDTVTKAELQRILYFPAASG